MRLITDGFRLNLGLTMDKEFLDANDISFPNSAADLKRPEYRYPVIATAAEAGPLKPGMHALNRKPIINSSNCHNNIIAGGDPGIHLTGPY